MDNLRIVAPIAKKIQKMYDLFLGGGGERNGGPKNPKMIFHKRLPKLSKTKI